MSNHTLEIAKKEARSYFNAPTAYVVITFYLLITGYFFSQPLFLIQQASIEHFLDVVPLLLVFFIPAVSMRLVAEEIKSGTIEVLMTLPVREHEILAGKFLASVFLLLGMILGTLPYPITVGILGKLDWGATMGAYLGLFFMGAGLLSMGLFASTLTRNQVVAFILGLTLCFLFFLMGKVGMFVPEGIRPLVEFLGLDAHFDNFSRGILDTRDILYFLTLIGFFLFLSHWNLTAKRWR